MPNIEISTYDLQVKEIAYTAVDKTLTIENMAAEAKATGDAINAIRNDKITNAFIDNLFK